MKHLPNINSPADLKNLTPEELVEVAAEVRQHIIHSVSETGGHLATNLGSVELTVALHHIYDAPKDKIIWDVSHQAYAHKVLTGRKDQMHTLRQYGGISGFAKRDESEYDHFGAGHASTSISVGLGFVAARDLKGDDNSVVVVIGDGSMTGGLAFEGLNNAGTLQKNMLVILNDNTWSISKNVGAISKYMTSIMSDNRINQLRDEIWEFTGRFKRRDKIRSTISRLEDSIKGLVVPGMVFEKMGFRYFGPIDGHDLPLLVRTLQNLKQIHGPVILHIATVKGKGYEPAEEDPYKYHGVGKFDKITGKLDPKGAGLPAYTKVFGDTMVELGDKNKRVVAITAAMSQGTGLDPFGTKFPDRFFDVGIAEAHAGCFAAGLAADGMKPYLTIYSTFLQRAYDQVIHDIGIHNLPVTICMDRAGLVGEDGPTHHGVFDIAYLSAVPNYTICAPKDGNEFRAMLHYTADHDMNGPVAIRYPRESVPVPMTEAIPTLEWGKWELLTPLTDIVFFGVGTMVAIGLEAAGRLRQQGISISVVNARFLKPLDIEFIDQIRQQAKTIITAEEACLRGGFGQAMSEYLLSNGYTGKFQALGIPDDFVTHGARKYLMRDVGLDVDSVVAAIEAVPDNKQKNSLLQRLMFRRTPHVRKTESIRKVG